MEMKGQLMDKLPRCNICGRVVRVVGVGRVGVWCLAFIKGALPFVGLLGGGIRGTLRDYREGLESRADMLKWIQV